MHFHPTHIIIMKSKEEIEKMSDEERRIATAQLCGWRMETLPDSQFECGSHECRSDIHIRWINPDPSCKYATTLHQGSVSPLPNYLNSLDAMHEAEWGFLTSPHRWNLFRRTLSSICAAHFEEARKGAIMSPDPIFSTARQRNVAFLMVMLSEIPL